MDKDANIPLEPCKELAAKILNEFKDEEVNIMINALGMSIAFLFSKLIPYEDQEEAIEMIVTNLYSSLNIYRKERLK